MTLFAETRGSKVRLSLLTLSGLLVAAMLGVAAAHWPWATFFLGTLLIVVAIAWVRGWLLHLVVLLVYAELIVGGSGRYWEFWDDWTIRKLLFVAVWVLFIYAWLADDRRSQFSRRSFACSCNAALMGVMTFVAFGLIVGLVRGNRPSYIVGDAQGFLYLSLAIPFAYFSVREKIKVEFFLSVFMASTVIYGLLKTLMYLSVYLGYLSMPILTELLVEDAGQVTAITTSTGEMRLATVGDLFPVLAMPLFVATVLSAKGWRARVTSLACTSILLLALTASNSRGFWLGAFVGLGVLAMTVATNKKLKILAAIAVGFVGAILLVPDTMDLLAQRAQLTFDSTEAGNVIRAEQAPKLIQAGFDHPVVGNGFGATLPLYYRNPDTPYAFELQTLAFFMKMGFLGCVAWLVFLAWLAYVMLATSKHLSSLRHSMSLKALVGGVVALLLVGSANPHISSPTGMGFMVLTVVAVDILRRHVRKSPKKEISRLSMFPIPAQAVKAQYRAGISSSTTHKRAPQRR